MKRVIIVIVVVAGLIAAVIAARKMAAPVVWQVAEIQPLDAPAAATGSAQPQLSVQGDTLLLSWIELINADATLKFAERTSTGWSAARKVSAGRDWFVNWADVPSVVRLADGSLAAHWLQESALQPVRLRRPPRVFERPGPIVDAGDVAPPRRYADRTRVCFVVPGARRRARPRLARWAGHEGSEARRGTVRLDGPARRDTSTPGGAHKCRKP